MGLGRLEEAGEEWAGALDLARALDKPELEGAVQLLLGVLAQIQGDLAEAEERLRMLSSRVMEWSGEMPVFYIRSGNRRDELFKLLEEEPSISVLVLGSATQPGGPGPLISALTGKFYDRLHIPLTIVPGSLTEEEVDALTLRRARAGADRKVRCRERLEARAGPSKMDTL